MNAFLAGQAVTLKVAAADDLGNPIVASAASYRVIDQNGVELVMPEPVVGYAGGDAVVTISADDNTLLGDSVRALRTVEVSFTVTGDFAGVVVRSESYIVERTEVLTIPQLSFQTYQQAIFEGFNLIGLTRWMNASRVDRVAALMQAKNNLCALRYRYTTDRGQSYLNDSEHSGVGRLDEYSLAEYNALPLDFRQALNRAQVVEADHLLRGDSDPLKQRENGIQSITIGESTTEFREGTGLIRGICPAAMRHVAKYVDTTIRMTRT